MCVCVWGVRGACSVVGRLPSHPNTLGLTLLGSLFQVSDLEYNSEFVNMTTDFTDKVILLLT